MLNIKDLTLRIELVTELLKDTAVNLPPDQFSAFFCGIIANTVENMPQSYYNEFTNVRPCKTLGCDCHTVKTKIRPVFDTLREDHIKTFKTQQRN